MSISPLNDSAGPCTVMIAFGWLLLIVGWLVERPYSLVLFAAAVGVLVPEAVRGIRAHRRRAVR